MPVLIILLLPGMGDRGRFAGIFVRRHTHKCPSVGHTKKNICGSRMSFNVDQAQISPERGVSSGENRKEAYALIMSNRKMHYLIAEVVNIINYYRGSARRDNTSIGLPA